MEIKFKMIVLIIGILCTGLTAGLCFTWSNAVTPGIGRLDNLSFLKSFQAMNRSIINGPFLFVFFTPAVLLFINAYLFKNNGITFGLFLTAAILFFIGIGLITIFGNVPLNEILEQAALESLTKIELEVVRKRFEHPWNAFHTVRTITSILSFVLLLIGTIYIS